jgi:HAE1 family hydrophobic/amphiphilic exporter-1
MGRAVIGGVIASTLLTLIVVPVLLVYIDRLTQRITKRPVAIAETPPTAADVSTASLASKELTL